MDLMHPIFLVASPASEGPPSVVPWLAAAGEIPTSFREAAACRRGRGFSVV